MNYPRSPAEGWHVRFSQIHGLEREEKKEKRKPQLISLSLSTDLLGYNRLKPCSSQNVPQEWVLSLLSHTLVCSYTTAEKALIPHVFSQRVVSSVSRSGSISLNKSVFHDHFLPDLSSPKVPSLYSKHLNNTVIWKARGYPWRDVDTKGGYQTSTQPHWSISTVLFFLGVFWSLLISWALWCSAQGFPCRRMFKFSRVYREKDDFSLKAAF